MGTTAAAASVGAVSDSFSSPQVHITIDRPFLFLVHKKENILFAGRVVDPQYHYPEYNDPEYDDSEYYDDEYNEP